MSPRDIPQLRPFFLLLLLSLLSSKTIKRGLGLIFKDNTDYTDNGGQP